MKILLTGASGFVGQKLGEALVKRGDSVVAVVRDPKTAKLSFAAEFRSWRELGNMQGIDAIVHLAGESVAQRWSDSTKKKIISSRVGTAHALLGALANSPGAKPAAFISASAIGFYGDRGEAWLTEADSPGADFLAKVCVAWEKSADDLAGKVDRVVKLRFAMVLGEGGALKTMLPAFKLGLGGRLGSGKQWLSWIHVDDLVSLLLFALDQTKIKGIYNAAAPEPVRNSEFAKELGKCVHRPALVPAPAFALKLALGEMAGMLLGSQRVSAEKIKAAGFSFKFASLREALTAAID